MSNISYVRAGLSCVPFIGFLATRHNIRKTTDRINELSVNMVRTRQETETLIDLYKQKKDYHFFGATSLLLTIASLVTLVALGVLSTPVATCLGIFYTFLTATSIRCSKKEIEEEIAHYQLILRTMYRAPHQQQAQAG